jgi:hypothetical protein
MPWAVPDDDAQHGDRGDRGHRHGEHADRLDQYQPGPADRGQ